jgi:hypothetical protein
LQNREIRLSFTGTRTVNGPVVDPTIYPPPPYNPQGLTPGDQGGLALRYGAEWDALRLDRAESLNAEDFSRVGGAHGWAGTDVSSGPDFADGFLTVTGSGSGSPRIDKTLASDFEAMQTATGGPARWWNDNGSLLTALSAEERAAANAWWNRTGYQGTDVDYHLGDWHRIGRKLLADSDVFNWSAYRYADLTGYADADCDATLTIDWDEIYFEPFAPGSYDVALTRTPNSADFTIRLTTVPAARRIDLASRAGHHGLRYVRSLRVAFPNGKTIHLSDITLREDRRPTADVHFPTDDKGYLSALSDGKHSLFLSVPHSVPPSSGWGWPVFLYRNGQWQSHLLSDLATELSLQEGWTATVSGAPDHDSPNFAVWLKETFQESCPATLRGRRSFGRAEIPPHFNQAFDMEGNLGSAVQCLVFDPDTGAPAQAALEIDGSLGAEADGAVSDATGYGELDVDFEDSMTVYAGKGTASESAASVDTFRGTWSFVRLAAKPSPEGSGPAVLDADRTGNRWAVYVPTAGENAGYVTLGRRLGVAPDWEYHRIAAGSDAWIQADETQPEPRIYVTFQRENGSFCQVSSKRGGMEGWSQLKTIAANGSRPFLRKDEATGLTFYLYWRNDNGGTTFLKRSDDDGTSFKEAEIAVLRGIPEQTATLDFLPDAGRTIQIVYTDGSAILSKISADNGLTWS